MVTWTVATRLIARAILAHRARAIVLMFAAGLSVASIVLTTGRTDAARRAIVTRLDAPAMRLVRLSDPTGQAGMDPSVVDRVAGLWAVEWVVGLDAAGPLGSNPGAADSRGGSATPPVGTRTYWGPLIGPLAPLVEGRSPRIGEAVAGAHARRVLGFADGPGTVDSDEHGRIGVVGTIRPNSVIANLDHYVLVHGSRDRGHLSELLVLVRSADEMESVVVRLPAVVDPVRPDALAIDRPVQVSRLRPELVGDVRDLDAAVLIGGLVVGSALLGVLSWGAVNERRREFGIRRSQGARRSTIGIMVLGESLVLTLVGSGVGAAAAGLVVARLEGLIVDPLLVAAVVVLVVEAGLIGSVPAAISAAIGEPIEVLRTP